MRQLLTRKTQDTRATLNLKAGFKHGGEACVFYVHAHTHMPPLTCLTGEGCDTAKCELCTCP